MNVHQQICKGKTHLQARQTIFLLKGLRHNFRYKCLVLIFMNKTVCLCILNDSTTWWNELFHKLQKATLDWKKMGE